ncbi:dihydrolipoyllysine-residue acetyltransferase [Marichromatium sp. AB32]|uniref:dihydrolipoyllysine-residue acetyltransferase n=1 Tax=Marichromatium sp. AB32 TaxID=2483363 RepID=UPI000F3CF54C|nr:dihydrolipoyllysine-residue acetyltransferase [Marichromatium sp. AB32]RNE94267.1 dihydrolipoyllysine-residue acetyltransferase [Marichromatium sp. AB32]
MATVEDILLPDIGDFTDVEIIEILVAPGDRIEAEQSILTLESDKATIEIPAPRAGVVERLKVAVGDRVSMGAPLLSIRPTDTPAQTPTAAPQPAREAAPPTPAPEDAPAAREPATGTPPPTATATEDTAVLLPDIGDFSEIPVIEVLVAPGDRVELDQSLLTLESDKATMEIPAPAAGVVSELAVAVGDTLNTGDLILMLRADAPAETDAPATPEPTPPHADNTPPAAPTTAPQPGETAPRKAPVLPRPEDVAAIARGRKAHASPAVRRFARELGVDLDVVKGTGPKGRVLKEDVRAFVKRSLTSAEPSSHSTASPAPVAATPAPAIDHGRFGPVERVELGRIRRISARHLHQSWTGIPHVTQFDEADITELEAFRAAHKTDPDDASVRLTLIPFLLKAVATALTRMPLLKASLDADGEHLIHKHYTHIGVAVDTPNGLMVPVVRDVDRKGLRTLAGELADLGARARAQRLRPDEMQGGCFTISSLGGIGGTAFTPIVNAPEVAILGVSRAATRPVWDGERFVPRLLLPLSLSYDHRVVDGADAARFTTLLGDLLGDIRELLL